MNSYAFLFDVPHHFCLSLTHSLSNGILVSSLKSRCSQWFNAKLHVTRISKVYGIRGFFYFVLYSVHTDPNTHCVLHCIYWNRHKPLILFILFKWILMNFQIDLSQKMIVNWTKSCFVFGLEIDIFFSHLRNRFSFGYSFRPRRKKTTFCDRLRIRESNFAIFDVRKKKWLRQWLESFSVNFQNWNQRNLAYFVLNFYTWPTRKRNKIKQRWINQFSEYSW